MLKLTVNKELFILLRKNLLAKFNKKEPKGSYCLKSILNPLSEIFTLKKNRYRHFPILAALLFLATPLYSNAQNISTRPGIKEKSTEIKYEKYALLIGNSNYNGPVFKKIPTGAPVEVDIRKTSDLLLSLGFPKNEISIFSDLKSDQLHETINDFFTRIAYRQLELKRTKPDTPTTIIIFFYYSGHGASFGTTNYLIPTNFGSPPSVLDAIKLSYPVDDLFVRHRLISSSANISTVLISVIDACRDRAVSFESMTGAKGGDMSPIPRLLTSIPTGILIAYASSQLNPAIDADGKGRPSRFTRVMLEEYERDLSIPIRHLFQDKIRKRMDREFKDVPGLADQLLEDIPLNVGTSLVQFSNVEILASLGKPIGSSSKGANSTISDSKERLQVIEGYIWLGNYTDNLWKPAKIADINANLVSKAPNQFSIGERFIAAGRLNIRSKSPAENGIPTNTTTEGYLGTLNLGAPIEVVGTPIRLINRSGESQYFAKVKVATKSVSENKAEVTR